MTFKRFLYKPAPMFFIGEKQGNTIGASLKELGKKWFAFAKININREELMIKLDK